MLLPASVAVPEVVLFTPTPPDSAAFTVPAWMSKAVVLFSAPLPFTVPPCSESPATLLLKTPRSSVAPLPTVTVLPPGRALDTPAASVPADTAVVPV